MSGDEDPSPDAEPDSEGDPSDPTDAFADELGESDPVGGDAGDGDVVENAQEALDDMMDEFGPADAETSDGPPDADPGDGPADIFEVDSLPGDGESGGAHAAADGVSEGGDVGVSEGGDVGVSEDGDVAPAADDGAGEVAEDPFGDLVEDVTERKRKPDEDPFADAFESVELDEVDADQLWDDLQTDDFAETVDDPQTEAERDTQVIEKRSYCQRCQYFAEPPDTACTNEGTDILAVVDTQHFRVADCPIIRGEEELRKKR